MEQYFYSGQIRRFLLQFIRAVSGFQVQISKNSLGVAAYQQVPVIYGDSSRQVAQIIKGNTENTLSTVPAFSVYISSLTYDRANVLNPYHVSKINLHERHYDENTNEWSTERGDSFTVERIMPAPYRLGLKLDIWTSNTEQKLQLIEQLATLFNPELEIQSTDNYVDWTSLSAIFLKETVWSSRNVPVGADDLIDVATMTFDLPIWLSPPAKVKKLGVIQKIITSIYDSQDVSSPVAGQDYMGNIGSNPGGFGLADGLVNGYSGTTGGGSGGMPGFSGVAGDVAGIGSAYVQGSTSGYGDFSKDIVDLSKATLMTRTIVTPMNVHLLYIGNTLRLLRSQDIIMPDGSIRISESINSPYGPDSWKDLFDLYGPLVDGVTQIRLFQLGTQTEVVGTVAYHPMNKQLLLYSPFPDTLPANDIAPVSAIIDPFSVKLTPALLSPATGYRVLILDSIGSELNIAGEGALAWVGADNTNLVAKENDIIEFNGTHWFVSFQAATETEIRYCLNTATSTQYKFVDNMWVKSVEGHYKNGNWRIVL